MLKQVRGGLRAYPDATPRRSRELLEITMSHAATQSVESVKRAAAQEFYCAEVWGGNRPIDNGFVLPGIRGQVFSQPAQGGRGGDIHYVSICGSGLISRLCLADVAGHGEGVATVSHEIHGLLRRYMNSLDERKVLAGLNRRIAELALSTMTTAVAISYFPPLRRLSVTYAGHPPVWLYRRERGHWERLAPESRETGAVGLVDLPLGIDGQTAFTRRKLRVEPGDRLLAVTDGVLEAPAPDGELFGDERVDTLLHAMGDADERAVGRRIIDAVRAHAGDSGLGHDDMTLLTVEFTPGPRGMGVWHGLKRRLFGRPRALHPVSA